jgi:hypothetical protein
MTQDELKYPIGQFERHAVVTAALLTEWIAAISSFPERLRNEVVSLTDEQLNTPYRPEGWTIR